MAVAKRFSNRKSTSDLPLTVLVELSSSEAPKEAVDEVIRRAEAGEKVTVKEAKAVVKKARARSEGVGKQQNRLRFFLLN